MNDRDCCFIVWAIGMAFMLGCSIGWCCACCYCVIRQLEAMQ